MVVRDDSYVRDDTGDIHRHFITDTKDRASRDRVLDMLRDMSTRDLCDMATMDQETTQNLYQRIEENFSAGTAPSPYRDSKCMLRLIQELAAEQMSNDPCTCKHCANHVREFRTIAALARLGIRVLREQKAVSKSHPQASAPAEIVNNASPGSRLSAVMTTRSPSIEEQFLRRHGTSKL